MIVLRGLRSDRQFLKHSIADLVAQRGAEHETAIGLPGAISGDRQEGVRRP
jgi:hypothetical protein